jgi:hypothetical protein
MIKFCKKCHKQLKQLQGNIRAAKITITCPCGKVNVIKSNVPVPEQKVV